MTMPFETATKSPRYAELIEHEPSVTGHLFWGVVGIAFCLAATVGCLYGVQVLEGNGALLAGGGAVVMAVMTFFAARGHLRFRAAPLQRRLARVKDETIETQVHTSTTRDRQRNRTRTTSTTSHSYFLLLEFEDGERESHQVDEEISRLTATGDVGVAYLKDGVLLDFKAVTGAE